MVPDPRKKYKLPKSGERIDRKPKRTLEPGSTVKSAHFEWKVLNLLGEGGFGEVYKVVSNKDTDEEKPFAMKTEKLFGHKAALRLKIEAMVMVDLRNAKCTSHFTSIIDRGKFDKGKFVVMNLVGPSIHDIRFQYMNDEDLSQETVMVVAVQTLEAIAELHDLGWIHRDIKPQNFTVGLGDQESTIFLLDFGIARQLHKKGTKQLKPPRQFVRFLGTLRFATRRCHAQVEQGKGDDLEAWLYMHIDLFDAHKGLPWKNSGQSLRISDVHSLKVKFMENGKLDHSKIPDEFRAIKKKIGSYTYDSIPEYSKIRETLMKIMDQKGFKMSAKLDWVGLQKKREKKAVELRSEEAKQQGTDDNRSVEEMKSNDRSQDSGEARPRGALACPRPKRPPKRGDRSREKMNTVD